MENKEQEINIEEINAKKCYSCGKVFRTPANLQVHKNRKTPCLIREVAPQDLANPNRCIFCNKIFKQKCHLTRHLGKCKIKNGGMNILDEKVRYEQEFRILKEKDQKNEMEIIQMREQMKYMQEQMNRMEKQMALVPAPQTINNINNGTINNNITINLHNYDKPKVDTLMLTQDDLLVENVTKKLIELIWFNKDIPENHTLYRPNIKEQRLLVHKDNTWKHIAGDELSPVFTSVKNTAYLTGNEKINGGSFYHTDTDFSHLYPVVQEAIKKFNLGEQIADGTIMEIITENREIVRPNLPPLLV